MKKRSLGVLLVMTFVMLLGLAAVQTWLSLSTVRTQQLEALQCGQWCLMRTAHVLGLPLSAEKAIEVLPHNWDGHSMADVKNAFYRFGFDVKPVKSPLSQILKGPLPAVLHLTEPDHYVVAVSTTDDRILIFDARGMRQRIRTSSVNERFSGYALLVSRDSAKSVPPNRKSKAQIQFETLYSDQGDIPQGFGTIHFSFPLTNPGSEPLLISGLSSDCACLQVRGPEVIPPGGSGIVTAEFRKNPESKTHFFRHTVTVESNDTDFPVIPLLAAGNTGTTVAVSPFVAEVNATSKRTYLFVRYGGDDASLFNSVTATSTIAGVSTRVISTEEYRKNVHIHFPTSDWSSGNQLQKVVEISLPSDVNLTMPGSGSVIIKTSVPGFSEIIVPCKVDADTRTLHKSPTNNG